MSRIFTSSFRQSSSHPNPSRDPLLGDLSSRSERSNSISLQNLSPQASRSPAVSPSPPPSFYRSKSPRSVERPPTLSPSPSRTKGKGRAIQFAAPPPPIATSVLLPRHSGSSGSRAGSDGAFDGAEARHRSPQTSMVRRRGSGSMDPLLALSRRELALQKELQELLDAQSFGLIQGFGGQDGSEGGSEAGSSTPTYNSTRSRSAGKREVHSGVVPVRQPRNKPVSLRGARRGLLRDMGELASIKNQEVTFLIDSITQRESALRKVGIWERRIEAFQKQLASASDAGGGNDEEGREIAELRNEERAVENEIREMEDRLAQMRARRKWIQERVREGENKREARLSSYRGALREVEGEVKDFLRRPPAFTSSPIATQEDLSEGFLDLPVGRRTLGMAKELWTREISQIETRRSDVEKERDALEEGAKMWEDSARQVMEFEDGLRVQMRGDMQNPAMLRGQVQSMGRVIEGLERNVRVAEEKGWNLLICALGAELEAFKEGEGILKAALGMVDGLNGVDDGKLLEDGVGETTDEHNGLEELNGAQNRSDSLARQESLDREDSEDDGPNLGELLVDNSHRDGESSLD